MSRMFSYFLAFLPGLLPEKSLPEFAVGDEQRLLKVLQQRFSCATAPDAQIITALLQHFAGLIYGYGECRYREEMKRPQPFVESGALIKDCLPHLRVRSCFYHAFILRDQPFKLLQHAGKLRNVFGFWNALQVLNQLVGYAQVGFIFKRFTARGTIQLYHFLLAFSFWFCCLPQNLNPTPLLTWMVLLVKLGTCNCSP